jgi:flagellar assembly factor FliW
VGARQNQADTIKTGLQAIEATLTQQKSDLSELDAERAITEMLARQTAYQSAMLASSRSWGGASPTTCADPCPPPRRPLPVPAAAPPPPPRREPSPRREVAPESPPTSSPPSCSARCGSPPGRAHLRGRLYGFAEHREFATRGGGAAGLWCCSRRRTRALAFLLADPFPAFPDYAPDVPEAELAQLGGGGAPPAECVAAYAVVTLGGGGKGASVNLRAPVLLDTRGRRGRQVVLPAERRGVAEPFALG